MENKHPEKNEEKYKILDSSKQVIQSWCSGSGTEKYVVGVIVLLAG